MATSRAAWSTVDSKKLEYGPDGVGGQSHPIFLASTVRGFLLRKQRFLDQFAILNSKLPPSIAIFVPCISGRFRDLGLTLGF